MLDRGFKTWCENTSLQIRRKLDIGPTGPLRAEALADYLGVRLLTPDQVQRLSSEALQTLLETEKDEWSAVTVSCGDRDIIIYNSSHSPRRQSNDLTHEMAHLLLQHKPATVHFLSGGAMALRSYDQKQEEEANWLSGCLLLPREALLVIARSNTDYATAAQSYNVSVDLLTMRLNVSGVNTQMKRYRQRTGK